MGIEIPNDASNRLSSILMPWAVTKLADAQAKKSRFVHYTSAEAAVRILEKEAVWMRNAACMNDSSEVQYGLDVIRRGFLSYSGKLFKDALEQIQPGILKDVQASFDPLAPTFLTDTYITCFSEHLNLEDDHGRLSMWRAYSSTTGVALVMNSHPFVMPSDALMAWTTPVAYVRDAEFDGQLDQIAQELLKNIDWLADYSREKFLDAVIQMLSFAAVSIKHIGFEEEKEWRVVHLPHLFKSERLIPEHVVVNGIPQKIFKIPLQNHPDHGFTGAEPHELINRVIIGPTQYPAAIRDTFVALLDRLNVPNANEKVVCSGIPLRC
jgi:hypothetical protein